MENKRPTGESFAALAQLVEREIEELGVAGSIPAGGTRK